VPTKVNFEKASAKIKALGEVLKRPLREVLASGARVAAISCARTSQPFGTGNEALQKGLKAVAGDMSKVYRGAADAYADISNPRYAALFWKAYKAGEYDEAQLILKLYGDNLRGVPIRSFDGGAAHKSARNSTTGRVQLSRPAMIVADVSGLVRYLRKRQDNVGFGKGGWADAARQISGSARGLRSEGDITANWITRKASGLGKFTPGGTDSNPSIMIASTVRYGDRILQGSAKNDAIRIARERMIANLSIAVAAEARKLRSAA
jgi:hypothetical protein